jgi:ABC-type Na+ efflux pump permease subunit
VRINTTGNTVFTQKNSRGYALLAALSVVFTIGMVGTTLVPNIILEEKHTKTMDALLVSPASPSQVVLGKAVTGLFYCLTAAAVAFVLNLTLVNLWGLAVLAAVLGSLFTVALGLLLGSAIVNRGQLTLWAWILLAPLLGAPLLTILVDVLPRSLISALGWIPTVALSRLLRLSFLDCAPLAQVGPELALVVGWTVADFDRHGVGRESRGSLRSET